MSNVPFAVYTESGNELTNGLSEVEARTAAQRFANDRGESVDVYQGSRLVVTVLPARPAH
jgi:hypothetical protein